MQSLSEDSRWSANPARPTGKWPTAAKARRALSGRDLIAILAGSVAITGLSVAAWRTGDDHQGVTLRQGSGAAGTADMTSGEWKSGSAKGVRAGGPLDPALVAETREDHARQTQAFTQILQPRLKDGGIAGFTIGNGTPPPIFTRAGLKAGDVLVAINGVQFQGEEMVARLSEEIAGSQTAEFEVERNGRLQKMTVSLVD